MGLFSRQRRKQNLRPHPISAFWSWWAAEGSQIDPHRATRASDELTRRVAAIHPDLTWHFGPGSSSEHRLTVSAGGIAAVRPSAERWLRAAPPPGQRWEFRASQEANLVAASGKLSIHGHEVDLSQTTFRVEPVEEDLRVHVGVHHPAFARMSGDVRSQITCLVLDWVLGEDDVERWLGHIEPLQIAPESAASTADLRSAVEAIARSRDADVWTLAQ